MERVPTIEAPAWSGAAIRLVADCESRGIRIKRLRLTQPQLEKLRRYTGQIQSLLGYPVSLRGGGRQGLT